MPQHRRTSRPSSPLSARARRVRRRADTLLADDPLTNVAELDDVITDACATVLILRRQQRRIESELSAVIEGNGDDARSAARAAELARHGREVREQLARLQDLIDRLMPYRRAWERGRKR